MNFKDMFALNIFNRMDKNMGYEFKHQNGMGTLKTPFHYHNQKPIVVSVQMHAGQVTLTDNGDCLKTYRKLRQPSRDNQNVYIVENDHIVGKLKSNHDNRFNPIADIEQLLVKPLLTAHMDIQNAQITCHTTDNDLFVDIHQFIQVLIVTDSYTINHRWEQLLPDDTMTW